MLYKAAILIVRFVFLFCFRTRIQGRENVPQKGAAILAVNHSSYFDPVFAGICCPRQLRFMAKSELFKNPLFGGLIKRLGAFPVARGKGDIGALKNAFSILKNEEMLLIFPQGRRTENGAKGSAQSGAVMIAHKMECPIIPVWISGEYKWMHKITVTFGKPMTFEEYYGKKMTAPQLREAADNVLDKMYELRVPS